MPRNSPALQDLIDLELAHKRAKSPSFPDAYRVPPKFDTSTSNGLTKAIIRYIDLRGGWATRISTEGRVIASKRVTHGSVFGPVYGQDSKRIPTQTKTGTADIHAVWRGRHLSIEVKIGRDRQSEEQIEVMERIRSAGGEYFIARTFEEFHQWFNALPTTPASL